MQSRILLYCIIHRHKKEKKKKQHFCRSIEKKYLEQFLSVATRIINFNILYVRDSLFKWIFIFIVRIQNTPNLNNTTNFLLVSSQGRLSLYRLAILNYSKPISTQYKRWTRRWEREKFTQFLSSMNYLLMRWKKHTSTKKIVTVL